MKTLIDKLCQQLQRRCLPVLIGCLFFHVQIFSQVRVPVVVHIISSDPYAVTDAQIIAAIDDLNDAFAHTGAYAGGPGANTGISFCLAKIDPDGGITNGITRTKSVLSDFDTDIENTRAKNLISWDTKRYANIWYVEGLKSEIYPMFICGKWSRMKEAGYATFSSGGDFRDGVVVTAFGGLLAHEMGHYLGLLHTFSINVCSNNDCSVDGDGICDTPPQSVFGGSCSSPQNSCLTDTLSGFTTDQPDLNANFMGYSGCANMFTNGQATRMNNVLTSTRSSLLTTYVCDPPCAENISASFTRDNWSPVTGSTVNFTSTSTGGSNYEWSVDGVVTGTNSPTFSYTFPVNGKYRISLKVYNANKSCFASYSHNVIVTCGVMARFYPDKRLIASKAPVMIDTILFTNRSVNATSYQWLMSNDTGMAEMVVSTGIDLNYAFLNKGNYRVRLIASNGGCSDTTETFSFKVEDPVFDGTVWMFGAECYQNTKVKLKLYVCNNGYATIPKGIPISFYDADPRTGAATKVDTSFLLPNPVLGKCCGQVYDLIIDVKKNGLNALYAVFNDKGTSVPISLPNTGIDELVLTNNIGVVAGFKYTVSVVPPSATMQPGDTLQLAGKAVPGSSSFLWTPSTQLSCSTCPNPYFIAKKDSVKLKLVATNAFGCSDSAFADIKVPPADDLTIKISDMQCYGKDSIIVNFEICNSFKRGIIPKDLKVTFYDADPNTSGKQLGPVFKVPADVKSQCAKFTHVIKAVGKQKIYAVVNDKGVVPFKMPNDSIVIEPDYANNLAFYDYAPEEVKIIPADTAILRKTSVDLAIGSTIYNPASILWNNGSGYTLSCTTCPVTRVTVSANSLVTMQMLNPYGCIIKGQAKVNLLPPDMVISILNTECYTNTKTRVSFRICMNNGYDSVFSGIPVSFYDGDPSRGARRPIDSAFYTRKMSSTSCDTFSAIINTPPNYVLYVAVNDKGNGAFPDKVYEETDLTNNTANSAVTRFIITVDPQDTSIYRNNTVPLKVSAKGGTLTSFTWDPVQYLSCTSCLDPVVRVPYSQEIIITGKNQNACIVSDTARIHMYTDGPVNIPNAFTPNGDGKNDVFYILGSRDIELLKDFSIYDRYGQKVFQVSNVPPNDPNYGWRGTVQGKNAATATYVYAVNVRFRDGREQLFKGTVTLIR